MALPVSDRYREPRMASPDGAVPMTAPKNKSGMSKEAFAAYMREYRQTPTGKAYMQAQRLRRKALMRAYARLAAKYRHDHLVFLNEELKKLRIDPDAD